MASQHGILIVDDTPENLQLLGDILEKQGHEVRVATDGPRALASAAESPPDLILLDIMMPGMDGYAVCRRLKDDPRLAMIPVIFISALESVEQKIMGFRMGGVDYITKPFHVEEVVARVQTHLKLSRFEELTREVEARRVAEAGLKAAKEYVDRIIRTANPMIVGLDLAGNVTLFNETAAGLTGYAESEVLGKEWFDIFTPRDRYPEVWAAFCRLAKDELPEAVENPILTTSGKERLIAWRNSVVRENGDIVGAIAFGFDVTEQRMTEQRLAVAQKMEALGSLAGGIAHDFNNILGAMIGYTDLALLEIPEGSPAKSLLENVERGGARAVDLVRQILAFSRQLPLDKKPIQPTLAVKEALKLLRASFPATIQVKERYESFSWVLADAGQIHQIAMNLCTNAGLAMREHGGVMEVVVQEIESDAALLAEHTDLRPGRHVCLTVTDTGCGIPPENLGRVFEPFFTTRPAGQGTGLGLSVVHGIVKSWGGAIGVTSQVGHGTTFKIVLPVCQAAAKAEPDRRSPTDGHERVMMVDDEVDLTEVAVRGLKRFGYAVSAFNDPVLALEAFRAGPKNFDVVITDMTMPGLTGDAVAAEVRRLRPDIPVVLVSGFSDRLTTDQALAAGFDGFVDKPLRPTALAQLIRKLCDGR